MNLLTLLFFIDAIRHAIFLAIRLTIFGDATHFGSIVFIGLHFVIFAVGGTIFVDNGLLFQFFEVFFKCLVDIFGDFFSLFFRGLWSFDNRIIFFVFGIRDYIIDRKV